MNAAEQAHMSKVIEKKQVRVVVPAVPTCVRADRCISQRQMQDFLRMYSNLVERCFTSCCNDFTSKALSTKEVRAPSSLVRARPLTARPTASQEQCVMNCTDKFLKHSERVGARFAEQNAGAWQRLCGGTALQLTFFYPTQTP